MSIDKQAKKSLSLILETSMSKERESLAEGTSWEVSKLEFEGIKENKHPLFSYSPLTGLN